MVRGNESEARGKRMKRRSPNISESSECEMLFKAGSRQPVMSSDRNLVAKEQNQHGVTVVMAREGDKLGTCRYFF